MLLTRGQIVKCALSHDRREKEQRCCPFARWAIGRTWMDKIVAIASVPLWRRPVSDCIRHSVHDAWPSDTSSQLGGLGWGARIRTWEWRNQNPLPYHLATPQCLRNTRPTGPCGPAPYTGGYRPRQRKPVRSGRTCTRAPCKRDRVSAQACPAALSARRLFTSAISSVRREMPSF
jgi:hypothetical protein